MKRRNYESDFIARVKLPAGMDGADFELRFKSTGGAHEYIVSRMGDVLKNCKVAENGDVIAIFVGHGLMPGMLKLKTVTWRQSEYCADGLKEVRPTVERVELVDGPSDDNSDDIAIDILLNYAIQDLYGIVRAKGYAGTEGEFYTAWVDLLTNGGGGGGGGLTEVKVSDVMSDADASVNLSDILRDISAEISGKAEAEHTHSGYAASEHTHNGYAASEHTHSGYVAVVNGKGLSSCDYTQDDKAAVESIGTNIDLLQKQIKEVDKKVDLIDSSLIIQIDGKERRVGFLNVGVNAYEIFEKSLFLDSALLLKSVGQTVDYILDSNPLGRDLLLKVEQFVVNASGVFLTNWIVNKIYIDASDNTAMQLRCERECNETPTKAWVTIRYIKGIISYDDINVKLTNGITLMGESITAAFPSLKFDKKIAVVWSQDDAMLDIYNKFFKYANGRWVDYARNYHEFNGTKSNRGEQPIRKLTYSDGCGNVRIYTFDSAFVSYNNSGSDGTHYEDKYAYEYISWRELQKFFDFNNSITNHGGGDQSSGHEYESIANNGACIANKIGFTPYIQASPGGTDLAAYDAVADKIEDIYYQRTKDAPLHSLDGLDRSTFIKSKRGIFGRLFTDNLPDMTAAGLKGYVDECIARTDHPLLYIASHGCYSPGDGKDAYFQWEAARDMYDYIYDNCSDSAWCVGVTELFDYLFTKIYSSINIVKQGDDAILKIKKASLPNMFQRDFSVVVKGSKSLLSLPGYEITGTEVIKDSMALRNGGLLVNINYNKDLLRLTEKYVAIYENNRTDDAKEDAMYFIEKLNNNLALPFLARINTEGVAPTLNSVIINNGGETTYERQVSIAVNATGGYTHYKISESADFTEGEWVAGTSPISFSLSSEYGEKNVYVKVKNSFGESGVKSDSIDYAERPTVTHTITTSSNNSEYGSVAPASQVVANGADAEVTATANDGYVIESWTGADSSTGVGTSSGSAIANNVTMDRSITCKFKIKEVTPPSDTKIIIFSKKAGTEYGTLANGEKFNWIYSGAPQSTTTDKQVFDTNNNIVGVRNYSENALMVSSVDSANPILADNKGEYPDIYLSLLSSYYGKEVYPLGAEFLLKGIAEGKYKAKILISTSETFAADAKNAVYNINGVESRPSESMNVVNNSTEWLYFNDINVTANGIFKMVISSTVAWKRVGFNAIIIEKIGYILERDIKNCPQQISCNTTHF